MEERDSLSTPRPEEQAGYRPETCRLLAERFKECGLARPLRRERYEPGEVLSYEVTGIVPAETAAVTLEVCRFVGGGFAGQVYQVRVRQAQGTITGIKPAGLYAMKILLPPSRFAKAFRDVLYKVGFQAPFQLQVNSDAARAGALWQKLIRRAAALRFGSEEVVADIYGTFVDEDLGSTGEIGEWIDGRTWLLEVDDNLTALRRYLRGKQVPRELLGSPEYRAKRRFMAEFVRLLHDLGAYELARQYQWWTCKSQPNCLKRLSSEGDPASGLVAVDFRAGLVLLPFLPMSPGDVALILWGIRRVSRVQFDRGDLKRLGSFVEANEEKFEDLAPAFEELKEREKAYRESIIDVTHHHVQLLTRPRLWRSVLEGLIRSWQVEGRIDRQCAESFRKYKPRALLFAASGFIPLLAQLGAVLVVVLSVAAGGLGVLRVAGAVALGVFGAWCGKVAVRLWGRADYRRHFKELLTTRGYFGRALRGKIAERLIRYLRSGRVSDQRALSLAQRPGRFFLHVPLSILPAPLHRFLTDRRYAAARLKALFVRPVRLYFNAEEREVWLRDTVREGRRKHMLSAEDEAEILSQIKEPYIQKYLKSLAVHVCTLPVTQLVAACVALYGIIHYDMGWEEAWKFAGGVFVLFQVTPVSPGSFLRGLYVVYLVLRERNVRDYNIAVCLSFMKYIGYLAFPIQMTYRYPTLARFMACHWATEAVHVVPVFGERGALLEHGVFNLFYNYPLTVRRRMRRRAELRRSCAPRRWHAALIAVCGTVLFALWVYAGRGDSLWLTLGRSWPPVVVTALAAGIAATAFGGGLALRRRCVLAFLCGIGLACGTFAVTALGTWLWQLAGRPSPLGLLLWPFVLQPLCAVAAALLWEVFSPEGEVELRRASGRAQEDLVVGAGPEERSR